MKIPNKRELEIIALNHLSNVYFDDKYLQNMYCKTTFFFID